MSRIRRLSDIEIDEVSLVKKAANKRKFFFVKNDEGDEIYSLEKAQNFTINIESDGTYENTKIMINGKDVDPLEFYFNLYSYDSENGQVGCRYTTASKGTSGGFKSIKTYVLSKSNEETEEKETTVTNEEIQKYLKEDAEVDASALAKNLDTITDYKADFPPELQEALDDLVSMAISQFKKESDSEETEETVESEEKEEKEEKAEEVKEEVVSEEKPETKQEVKEESKAPQEVKIDYDLLAQKIVAAQEAKQVAEENQEVDVSPAELGQLVAEAITGGNSNEDD